LKRVGSSQSSSVATGFNWMLSRVANSWFTVGRNAALRVNSGAWLT
jgi:hypothetical protein